MCWLPSDYMIERLIAQDMLQELDLSKIPNIANLTEGVKGLPYDPNNLYSAACFLGQCGHRIQPQQCGPRRSGSQGLGDPAGYQYAATSICMIRSAMPS